MMLSRQAYAIPALVSALLAGLLLLRVRAR
jgi:hypothetical protein